MLEPRKFDLGDVLEQFLGVGHPLTQISARIREEAMSQKTFEYQCERPEFHDGDGCFLDPSGEDMICCPQCALGRCLARAYRVDKPEVRIKQDIADKRSYLNRLETTFEAQKSQLEFEISELEEKL